LSYLKQDSTRKLLPIIDDEHWQRYLASWNQFAQLPVLAEENPIPWESLTLLSVIQAPEDMLRDSRSGGEYVVSYTVPIPRAAQQPAATARPASRPQKPIQASEPAKRKRVSQQSHAGVRAASDFHGECENDDPYSEDEYVSKIVDSGIDEPTATMLYKVRWYGHGASADTWHDEQHLQGAQEALKVYKEKSKKWQEDNEILSRMQKRARKK
jgi:hypothetical protein